MQRHALNILMLIGAAGLVLAAHAGLLDNYVLTVLMFMGINIIFASGLNLVNGYMGELSCGHAGFMCVGAYTGSLLSAALFAGGKLFGAPLLPPELAPLFFPLILAASGLCAAVFGLIVALPSFHTRGDYLAIITIAANYIIISVIANIDAIGGPRGIFGMKKNRQRHARCRGFAVDAALGHPFRGLLPDPALPSGDQQRRQRHRRRVPE
jgi:branched-chain amino acid transport system permease protein